MTDFFISYTQADRSWAEWIAWTLEAAKHGATLQAWDFLPGDQFVEKMDEAARRCGQVIAVLSPDYETSRFGLREWATTVAQKKRLIPVRVREVEPGGQLAGLVYVDLVGLSLAAARRELLVGVSLDRKKPAREPTFPGAAGPAIPVDFSDLPQEKIPDVGPLPHGSRMPFAHNPLFVGREEDLRTLASHLKAGETTAVGEVQIAAATGLGGIGKTQLAVEFVHRYGRYFEAGVLWMSFAEASAVPAEVAACGRGMGLDPSFDSLSLERQLFLVEQEWQDARPRLLVFDNCEDQELLARWRPRTGGARVLVTSRRSTWDPALGVQRVPLAVLPRLVSVKLLRRFRADVAEGDPGLAAIAKELGDLPLALHLAGSFLQRYAQAEAGQPVAYLAALREGGLLDHPSLQGKASGISPTSHEAHVARTFALSFERLDLSQPSEALAKDLLTRAAYFAPGEPIPRLLLGATVKSDDTEIEDALARLTELGLLEAGAGGVVIHRLVASFARAAEDGEATREAVEDAVFLEASRINRSGVPGPLLTWQAHFRSVTEAAWRREDATAASLCNELGAHLWLIGDFSSAWPFYERALAIREKVLGPDHPATATSLNNLGVLLDSQGDLAAARPCYERALAIWEKVLGPGHPTTASSLNNLGELLRSQGDLAVARPYHERALAVREKILGPDHRDTARSLNNLGLLVDAEGDAVGARRYYERALAIREKVLGPDHPETAVSLNNLGSLLETEGDAAGARPYFERALRILDAQLGPDHPDTKLVRENLEGLQSS